MQKSEFRVWGLVQGVGFRFSTWRKANELGLCGYVRNQADGSVYIIACGEENALNLFRQWLQTGPRNAKVTRVIEQPYHINRAFTGFQVER
ncbi:acylphosphatase [Mesocricetibacter intestinalis]|uniref:Acylphosphatase n=1 Tax=Mesocricetibacter intestinalis TaxID=1521930 RepID=A0A4R6V7V2_9PAST|nr:acylphosphatase [Mesocricetibacter intestinalis]TDQ57191.1 acylphosphatase [Mesocricetibacter intestinalis]